MSVRFDLTVIAPELLDAVVCMDNSPAYEAFKTEIEAILADFTKTSHFGSSFTIDEKALTENSVETLLNMHQAFLLWTIRDELKNGSNPENGYSTYLKLFFKSVCDKLASLNGGNTTVDASEVSALKDRFLAEIGTDKALYDSIKDFFAGYVYGYFFNYLEEQSVMFKYAEFLVCIGVMTGKITATIAAQQKIMPKMGTLLGSDRFKYISGYLPLDVMLDLVYDRFSFPNLSDEEMTKVKDIIKNYMTENYDMQTDDEQTVLISAKVTTSVMTGLNSTYVNVPVYSADTYDKCFSGVRVFLDADKDDTGEFNTDKIISIINKKCSADYNEYFTTEREPNLDVALGSGLIGYKYPLVFKDASDFWYSSTYQYLINDLLDMKIYAIIDTNNLPIKEFPFADAVLKTNAIRTVTGSKVETYSIRADKKDVLIALSEIYGNKMLSETDRRMLMLEQMLYILSGNCSKEKYSDLVTENVFGTRLYEEYIRFRMNRLCDKGMESLDTKKNLLDEINKIK